MQDKSSFFESQEGFTYIKQSTEKRHSQKVLGLLYSDSKKDKASAWDNKIFKFTIYIKLNELDEQGMHYIDVDKIMDAYMDEYF
jgi:hypothetical protein